jgi:hypothetical protein
VAALEKPLGTSCAPATYPAETTKRGREDEKVADDGRLPSVPARADGDDHCLAREREGAADDPPRPGASPEDQSG